MAKTLSLIPTSEFYKVITFLLQFVCVTSEKNANQVFLLKFNVPFWCVITPLMCLSMLQVIFNVHLIATNFDLKEFCYAQSCIAYQSTAYSKILAIAISSSKLDDLFISLDKIHPSTAEEQIVYKIPKWLLQTKRLMLNYACIQIFMIASYVVLPFYTYIKVFLLTGVWKMEFPLKFWLPFDTDRTSTFYTIYMLQSWVGFSASLYLSTSDLLLLAIIHLVCIQFDYIHRCFSELQLQPNRFNEMDVIKACVAKQNTIIQ